MRSDMQPDLLSSVFCLLSSAHPAGVRHSRQSASNASEQVEHSGRTGFQPVPGYVYKSPSPASITVLPEPSTPTIATFFIYAQVRFSWMTNCLSAQQELAASQRTPAASNWTRTVLASAFQQAQPEPAFAQAASQPARISALASRGRLFQCFLQVVEHFPPTLSR